jgi:ketosteroid isomerase-like protein
MSIERAAFLDAVLPAQIRAERAMHNGDSTPRLAIWSRRDPVTLFGAGVARRSGWPEVRAVFEWLATTFRACDEYDFELVAADANADLAYTVGIERYRAITAAGDEVHNTLRVTHLYRREGTAWKIVHRHGDHSPEVHDADMRVTEQGDHR